ncbi:MAG TPA: 3-methylcrotonyl-CoA carboxylase, partial [Gammaproteobacteria bacterium]|nr:3-methylcrotonyl-CoA carboxylase [Gammaproteobacteria bacterium]
ANRGEIACRVITSAQQLGIRCVAVYSDADQYAKHVQIADEAWHIGPPAAADSYLNIDRILEVAQQSGAEAIHPGYGFLSENPSFVDACKEAGIRFIGPSADAIRAMGFKDAANQPMEKAGQPR